MQPEKENAVSSNASIRELMSRANRLLANGDIAGARVLAQQAYTLDKTNPDVLVLVSKVIPDPLKQRNVLKQALRIDPTHREARQRLTELDQPPNQKPLQVPLPPPEGPTVAASRAVISPRLPLALAGGIGALMVAVLVVSLLDRPTAINVNPATQPPFRGTDVTRAASEFSSKAMLTLTPTPAPNTATQTPATLSVTPSSVVTITQTATLAAQATRVLGASSTMFMPVVDPTADLPSGLPPRQASQAAALTQTALMMDLVYYTDEMTVQALSFGFLTQDAIDAAPLTATAAAKKKH